MKRLIQLLVFPRRPKSPPNSPNPELADITEELKGVYINRLCDGHGNGSGSGATSVANNGQTSVTASELIWDWSSRPNVPPRYIPRGGSTHRI